MSFLLDTNVLSEVRKPTCHPAVREWFSTVTGADLYLSVLAIGEIHQGIERLRRRDPRQAEVLAAWWSRLQTEYADRILPVTVDVAIAWARLNVPRPIPVVDGLMAATAVVHSLTFVTRNAGHFERGSVRLLNPFDDQA